MIIYDLNCKNGHAFEGWFQSAHDFDAQLQDGLVSCPSCGSTDVRRIPSAVYLSKADKESPVPSAEPSSPAPQAEASPPASPADKEQEEVIAAMQRLVTMITEKCEDVGSNFAEEARKIHYAEAPARPIRGEVSQQEYHELDDEGIDVFIMPRLKNNNLM